jgi:ATP-binding cassette subfamily B protein
VIEAPTGAMTPHKILFYAVLIFTIALVAGIIRFAQRRTIHGIARRIEYHLRRDFFSHLQKLSANYYNNVRTGDLMTRATSDMNAVRMVLSSAVMYTADAIVFFFLALVIMLQIDVSLTLLALLPYPVLAVLIRQLGKRVHKCYEDIQESYSTLNTKVQENLSGVRVVKAYTLENGEVERFREHNQDFVERNRERIRLTTFFFPLFRVLPGFGAVILLWVGGLHVINGEITLGDFVSFNAYLTMLIRPMVTLGFIVNTFERGAASMERINKIFDEKPEIYDDEDVRDDIKTVQGEIEFRELTFAYPDSPPVLKNINLKIPSGATVAIVGPTGCGKTTLVNLLARIYQAERGTLFVDGVDIHDIPVKTLRSNIGFIQQEPFLFSDLLRNNIAYGNENASEVQIKEASHAADLLTQIEEFPDGLQTFLGERGVTISGGQKQRTALARAILISPNILVLDDAFASVDTHTEDTILTHLKDIMADRTTILISHRISTVKSADLIVVLKDGEIVERGTHEELLVQNGIYANIHEKQLLQEELDEL